MAKGAEEGSMYGTEGCVTVCTRASVSGRGTGIEVGRRERCTDRTAVTIVIAVVVFIVAAAVGMAVIVLSRGNSLI